MHFRVWDGSTWVAVGPNDLAYVQKVDGGTITNSAGSDVDIPVVNNIQAGLMLPGDKNKIDGYPATPGDLAATLDLQAVTDNGNTTTNGASFGAGNIQLYAAGSADFNNVVKTKRYFYSTNDLDTTGAIYLYNLVPASQGTRNDMAIQLSNNNSQDGETFRVNYDGSALFAAKVTSALTVSGDPQATLTTKSYVDSTPAGITLQSVTDNGNTTTNGASFSGNVDVNKVHRATQSTS